MTKYKHSEITHLQAEHLPSLERLESALDLDLVLVLEPLMVRSNYRCCHYRCNWSWYYNWWNYRGGNWWVYGCNDVCFSRNDRDVSHGKRENKLKTQITAQR